MGLKLFDDDSSPIDDNIKIDESYARRLEHNKKREELQRYKELKEKGVIVESDDESKSESESDSDEEKFSKKDVKFFENLLKVRNKDPILKEKDARLFESDDEESSEDEEQEQKKNEGNDKKKPKYLKDVSAKHLMEDGPEFDEDSDDEKIRKKKSYNEEQEEIKKAFLSAAEEAEGDNDEGDFLRLKENQSKDDGEASGDGNFGRSLEEYFGNDEEMDENKKFLKEFFMKKMWIDKERKDGKSLVEIVLSDEEEIERQEKYELEYNFRYEENAGDRVVGYSRIVEGSVRKKENTRKEQRQRKEERIKNAEMERKEELKRLKNLKKQEMKEKMKKVMDIAGIGEGENCPFSSKDLEEEFDPGEYDKMMGAVFGEKYYNAEDEEFGSDRDEFEKPNFDEEDELLGLPKGWHVLESNDGFEATREMILKQKEDGKSDSEKEERKEETEEGKRKRKRKLSVVQRAKQEMIEELYKLDYEGTIGDLKTRFKYANTKPNKYGLKTEEILVMDDKELNQYAPLKKLAPYGDKEWKIPHSKRNQQKLRNMELFKSLRSKDHKVDKKKMSKHNSEKKPSLRRDRKEDTKAESDELNGNNLSRTAKRRRRQAPQLSHSRLVAYGKITSKSKKK